MVRKDLTALLSCLQVVNGLMTHAVLLDHQQQHDDQPNTQQQQQQQSSAAHLPALAVLPMGTGCDFAKSFGW